MTDYEYVFTLLYRPVVFIPFCVCVAVMLAVFSACLILAKKSDGDRKPDGGKIKGAFAFSFISAVFFNFALNLVVFIGDGDYQSLMLLYPLVLACAGTFLYGVIFLSLKTDEKKSEKIILGSGDCSDGGIVGKETLIGRRQEKAGENAFSISKIFPVRKDSASVPQDRQPQNFKPLAGNSETDYSHVLRVIDRLGFYNLSQSEKTTIGNLKNEVMNETSGKGDCSTREKINDGLGALLKIMSKYKA